MTRILVVDDEPLYVRLLEINLITEGYEVVTATNGLEALDLISSRLPDLVLLDLMMPKLDGVTTCERIRQFSNIPVIMVTAKGEEQERVKGLNVGADDYIVKPFSATEVLARVRAVLRRSQTSGDTTPNRFFNHANLRIDFARRSMEGSKTRLPFRHRIPFINSICPQHWQGINSRAIVGRNLGTTIPRR